MSIQTSRHIFCDIDDEGPCVGWLDTNPNATAAQMRATGKHFGWKRAFRNGRWIDICPPHADNEGKAPR